jgi:SAM-dependent methyltransferase
MSMNAEQQPPMERVACYVCGEHRHQPWAQENGFHAVRCQGCGLVYVNPRPTRAAISRAAQSGLHEGAVTQDETGQRDARKVALYLERLGALYEPRELERRGGRWFDVGCGFGEFLEALVVESAGALGVVGSEPNERKAAAARARGLDVSFRDLNTEQAGYGFISLLNVFSHVPAPPELLDQRHGLLEPGGELVLETGNWAELERRQIKDRLHLPDHLSFASEALLRRLLEAAGFEVLSVMRYPMSKASLLRRLLPAQFRAAPETTACDLWFRARVPKK